MSAALDVFRMRQYFDVVTVMRSWVEGIREDAGLLTDVRRALVMLPGERDHPAEREPFPPMEPFRVDRLEGKRLALMATGGSGALASVVGVAHALEEAGLRPTVISLCSGSALFGFPVAAGVPAHEVAEFMLALRPEDYVDVDWRRLSSLVPTAGRGFAGMIRGERIEATFRRLLGDMTLAELATPAYAPIWSVEENRLEYIGPRTHPDMSVARAIRMAIALPLFVAPVPLDGRFWCDGGLVDIFPVRPVLELEEPCDVALAINGFYPPGFAGEDATGWQDRRGSILYVASQVRTSQQTELARVNLARLRAATEVLMLEPVPYEKVRGVGFYRQFLNTSEWPAFMRSGLADARQVLQAPRPRCTGARTVAALTPSRRHSSARRGPGLPAGRRYTCRVAVRPPTHEGRGVTKAAGLQVVVGDFAHRLRTHRFPSHVFAGVPAVRAARCAPIALVRRPVGPGVALEHVGAHRLELVDEGLPPGDTEPRGDPHVVQRAVAVIEAEQQRADPGTVLVDPVTAHDAVGCALMLHLEHGPLVRQVAQVRRLGHDAVEAGPFEACEPVGSRCRVACAGVRCTGGRTSCRRSSTRSPPLGCTRCPREAESS